jgi:hypothetical protein
VRVAIGQFQLMVVGSSTALRDNERGGVLESRLLLGYRDNGQPHKMECGIFGA